MSEPKAGRELDALVAERVMGLTLNGSPYSDGSVWWRKGSAGTWEPTELPPYSGDIAATWLVVEKMRAHPHYVDFGISDGHNENSCDGDGPWYAHFCLGNGNESASASTPPLAICAAALRATEGDK